MSDNFDETIVSEEERRAREHVEELQGFYTHLLTYLLVSVLLVFIFLVTSGVYFWPMWPIMIWGLALLGHAVSVFGLFGIGNKEWKERKIRELMMAQERGLTAAQVRQVLQDELDEAMQLSPSEMRKIVERLENLEAIVTSDSWEDIEGEPASGKLELPAATDEDGTMSESEKAERIGRRVR